jgi:uncharacterized protein
MGHVSFFGGPGSTMAESFMIDKQLLAVLVCPKDRTPLSVADDQIIARINRAISVGRVKNQAGRTVDRAIDGGLLNAANTILYPILDGIPLLLPDEAILLAGLE